ncbi:HAMP domain-containing sensor histidine kinase [Halorubrum sp. Boch-26]|uniref:sensor histidine kinase n=1 Tax=Halorubrum sp. Boch-26 TaxID=2994426 RepID=UPI0024684AC5|nr:HAMP domain-containing sensor histidine kinase [Halorubrum sp. Boch-26]
MEPSENPIHVLLASADAGDGAGDTVAATPTARSLERRDDRFTVETVRDRDAAATLHSSDRFDCVVVAADFADGDGLGFLVDEVEGREALPRLLVVGVDRVADPSAVVAEALAAGVTDVVRISDGVPASRLLANRIANAVESRRAATEADRQRERLDRFVSGVSHDLKSPLNVAQGRLALARDDPEGEHLDVAATAVDRTLELIADLLTLAKQGEKPRELESVGLRDTVEECWATVATGDATLVVESDRRVLADPSRLKQLLENLIGNAVAHGGDDVTVGAVIPMYTATRADTGLPTGFYVADDGPGVPETERDRVFEEGYTTDNEGTGFGLNIVREVAAAHGWDVRVTESAGGGARFEVTGVDNAE